MNSTQNGLEPAQVRDFRAEFQANPALAARVVAESGGVGGGGETPAQTQWPDAPAPEAYHGLAGHVPRDLSREAMLLPSLATKAKFSRLRINKNRGTDIPPPLLRSGWAAVSKKRCERGVGWRQGAGSR